jgi:hypothetical protein
MTIPGPYWIRHAQSGEIQVCGRHGKIIERFTAAEEARADALLSDLQGPRLAARSDAVPPAPTKLEMAREVVRLIGRGADEQRAAEIVKSATAASLAATITRLRARAATN